MATVSGRTTIRAATAEEAADLSPRALIAYFRGGVYSLALVEGFAVALVATCRLTLIRASVLAAQIAHETKRFRFGGQVRPDQYNFAGLGATDDGAAGLSFLDPGEGVRAVAAHHGGYLFGPLARWPVAWLALDELAMRLPAVLAAGYGASVRRLGDYGAGKWATDPDYAAKVAAHANALLALEASMAKPRIALASGHHNTDGGNREEYLTVGRLVQHVAAHCRRLGMDVWVAQPDGPDADAERGDGDYPGGIWDVAAAVVREDAKAPFSLFMECHTQGVADASVRGVFGIHPDWGADVDADARDRLIPDAVRRISAATGIPVWSRGVMSERQTGVGLGGSRLGILNKTAPIAGHCTRLLIEYGAHSNRADFAIHRSEAFYEAAGRATAEAFAAFLGLPLAVVEAQAPPPEVAPWQPGGVAVTVPGTGREYWIVEPILSHYRLNGALARYGWPLSGLYTETEGEARGLAVQYFERARLEVQPDGTVTEGRLGAELLAARASES